ncbi:uncharacterized protein LOC129304851 [Prosopis cineraria]|uniref:uncharacterized protein LOC129304851 n=1 Tax=Prosopis cineraria TaxID=364024 RepID=UPI00240FBC7D|nr:uncharacterized protein LOC129304851 [Prosopis cineraria]XP_054800652.1 uncharacterized protein LOC129304851 [Prosopis cineraria]
MEEYGEKAEVRRMQREQERERRRIRDRERRQSMTQEQREIHLARRRRNYQLRRQRAANNNNTTFFPLDQAKEASTSRGHPSLVSYSISDYRTLHNDSGQESSQGSEVHMEALTYKPTNLPRKLRLNHIRQLARNLMMHSIADHDSQTGIDQIVQPLMPNGGLSGSTQKSLRLNRVKQLARSLNSPPKEISSQRLNDTTLQEATNNITFPGTYNGDGFKCC